MHVLLTTCFQLNDFETVLMLCILENGKKHWIFCSESMLHTYYR